MPDLFGNLITIPDPTIAGVYPIDLEPDVERSSGAEYVIHKIGLKKEQRILKRKGGNRWKLRHSFVTQADLENTLQPFFDTHRHPRDLFYFYDPFEQPCPDLTGAETTGRYVCRFNNSELDVTYLRDGALEVQIELIEVNTSTTDLNVGITWQYYNWRRPGVTLQNFAQADISGNVSLVHFVKIQPASGVDSIKVSDRRIFMTQTFGPTPTARYGRYLPRLLAWDIEQEIGSSDQASFVFDDADGVWQDYCKQVDLDRAEMDFTVYCAPGSGLLQLWRGYIVDWEWDQKQGTFTAQCEGGIQALQQQFPPRLVSTTCPLRFNDGGDCPYTAQGSGGDPDTCDKSLDGANGCTAHGMTNYFQGVVIKPQTATGKLNNTGFAGMFQKSYTSTSTPFKTVYGKPLPVIYGKGRQIVEADIFETRDESEFFVASGLLSEGPIGQVGQVLLDGMTQHFGYQPVVALGTLAQNTGTIIDPSFRSSRTAFVSIRRTDEVGLQNPNEVHRILVEVLSGVKVMLFWWWTGPFANSGEFDSSDPVGIAVDIALRALGIRYAPLLSTNWVKDFLLELNTYLDASGWCAQEVPSLVGGGTEKRFEYRGTIREPKPAIDHIREVLSNAPIDLVWSYGQISPKVRRDDITTPPPYQITFEQAQNIIDGTFKAQRLKPRFNHLTMLYSDIDYDFAERDITVYDAAHQLRVGFFEPSNPTYRKPMQLKSQRTLSGGFRASQVIRLATQELAEELGGGIGNEEEQRKARMVSLTAPLVGLGVEVGDVSKVIHEELPDGLAYVRWKRWRYSSDYQVQLSGPTVTASMYSSPIPQLPSSTAGDPVEGVPGGSQGSDGTENTPEELQPPVLTQLSINHRTAQVSVGCQIFSPLAPPDAPQSDDPLEPVAPLPPPPPPTTDEPPAPLAPSGPAPAPIVSGQTYFASLTGSDANSGTQTSPFRTVQKLMSVLKAGDLGYLRGGDWHERIRNDRYPIPAGTSWSAHITIAGFQSETVTVKNIALFNSAIQYLIFQDLTVDGETTETESVYLDLAHHIRFLRLKITRGGLHGVGAYHASVHHSEFLQCEVFNNGFWLPGGNGRGGYGLYIGGQDMLFDGCSIHDNKNYGFHGYNGHAERSSRNTVRFCRIYKNGITQTVYSCSGLLIGSGDDNIAHNNLVYDNFGGMRIDFKDSARCAFYFNTVFRNGPGIGIEVGPFSASASSTILRNNISYQNAGGNYKLLSGVVNTNNLWDGQNPLFVSTGTTPDLHLQAGSPAINAGIAVSGITTDFDGVTRGSPPEIGALEKV